MRRSGVHIVLKPERTTSFTIHRPLHGIIHRPLSLTMETSAPESTAPRMSQVALSINAVSSFLAHEQISSAAALESFLSSPSTLNGDSDDLSSTRDKVVVFCASAVLSTAEAVFSWAAGRTSNRSDGRPRSNDNVTLVLVGGVGHSTTLLHDAVKKHPVFNAIADEVDGKPEAAVLQAIAERFYHLSIYNGQPSAGSDRVANNGLLILVEDQSTNCGANASETRKVLERHDIRSPHSIVVVQDLTMCRRTVASFEYTYQDISQGTLQILSWPTIVPEVCVKEALQNELASSLSSLAYINQGQILTEEDGMWPMDRFLDLLMGEIPRLRDDANGYGPNGRGFIGHVEIPPTVETAWEVVESFLRDNKGENVSQRQQLGA
ncbi:hypothetical protein BKA56DRAFT_580350 [Ilyonectria sp. MPI-CAGE-AT-0026]|nr:hypothetical protein BKA56DRAFT_580350 [Ilyonectria sp. MPI-CAGE-AT-0026]